jgi:hypothetical protein
MRKKTRKNGKEMKSVTKKRVRKWLTSEKKGPSKMFLMIVQSLEFKIKG